MIFFDILIVVILLAVTAVVAAIETAITAASTGKIHQLKLEGNKKAKLVLKFLKEKDRIISALLIANNILITFLTTFVTTSIVKFVGPNDDISDGFIVALGGFIIAILIIIFGEVLPKTIAVSKAESVALATANILEVGLKVLWPITQLVGFIIKHILKILKIKDTHAVSSLDEIRGIIEHQLHEGQVIKTDRDMLGGILDLGNMKVEEIMTHRQYMYTLDVDTSIDEVINKILSATHTRIPIWQDNKENIIGILHIRDFLRALYNNISDYSKINLKDYLTEPWFIPENALVREQLHEFRKKRTHIAIVIDEYGDILGLVTLEDIIEEIVGQIEDEYDRETQQIVINSKNRYIIEGSTSIRDINRDLDWNLPDSEASTIAGLIIHEAERIPVQGETLTILDLKIKILKKYGNRIKSVIIQKIDSEDTNDDEL